PGCGVTYNLPKTSDCASTKNVAMTNKRLKKRPLSISDIVVWACAHREATGKWPTVVGGGIPAARFEPWRKIDKALRRGDRGLPGGSSLAQLLAERCGARNHKDLPSLTAEQILEWADEHHERTGEWPKSCSGSVTGARADGETWSGVHTALQ